MTLVAVPEPVATHRVRSIFISDVHLGTHGCQAERLLDFMRDYESEHFYLVGDIVDFWAMSRSINWSPAQNTVIQKILRRARQGQKVTIIPGNHDELLREYDGVSFGDILVKNEHVHEMADGRRFLLIHGDQFDQVTRHHRWLAVLGDVGYDSLVRLNSVLAGIRRLLRLPGYWSLAGYAKSRVKRAVSFIFDFEDSVIRAVRERGLNGVICGHIHSATIRNVDGIEYVNCGDWVDSCTAVVEHFNGRLELIRSWQTVVPGQLDGVLPSATAQSASFARPPCSSVISGALVSSAPTDGLSQTS